MNSDAGGKSALGEGVGLAEKVAAAGTPPAGWQEPGVVPSPVGRTYTQAELDAAVAAEREKWVPYVQHGKAGGQMCDRMKHSDYVCTCGLDELRARA